MDDEEAGRLGGEILLVLREQGFGWIADEVGTHLSGGKIIQKSVIESTSYEFDESSTVRRKGKSRRVNRASTEPFTPKEQLAIIVDALERTLTFISAMKLAILSEAETQSVAFVPDASDIPRDMTSGDLIRQKEHRLDDVSLRESSFDQGITHVVETLRARLGG